MKGASFLLVGFAFNAAGAGYSAAPEVAVLQSGIVNFNESDEVVYWEDGLSGDLGGQLKDVSDPIASIVSKSCTNFDDVPSCNYVVSVYEKFIDVNDMTAARVIAKYLVQTLNGIAGQTTELSVVGSIIEDRAAGLNLDHQILKAARKSFMGSETRVAWEQEADKELRSKNLQWNDITKPKAKILESDCYFDGDCLYLVSVSETFISANGTVLARIEGNYQVATGKTVQAVREFSVLGFTE
jgi:hypothetical protein